jgi:hypothetical protein
MCEGDKPKELAPLGALPVSGALSSTSHVGVEVPSKYDQAFQRKVRYLLPGWLVGWFNKVLRFLPGELLA